MIRENNATLLQQKFPGIYAALQRVELTGRFALVPAGDGAFNVVYSRDGFVFLHDRHHPQLEAERLVQSFSWEERPQHVIFYGIGLGYHIEAFVKSYPDIPFSIYEPDPEALLLFAATRSLSGLGGAMLRNIYTDALPFNEQWNIQDFLDKTSGTTVCSILPGYSRAFAEKCQRFLQIYQKRLKFKLNSMAIHRGFQKKWTRNSLENFRHVWRTVNIVHEKKKYFQGKPAMLVAAGPSLQQEIEQLRYIKERGLAYIFSVGSAINILLSHDIYPDAACTYDPGDFNPHVFEKVKRMGIRTIPMVFGSSVDARTMDQYEGPLLHMLISQDSFSKYVLRRKDGQALEVLNDASSIAIVTLQMLVRLGCNRIIFVGQDCAYQRNRLYADGVDYEKELTRQELDRTVEVEDVFGGRVRTHPSFIAMREELEIYIRAHPQIMFLNTSSGGARIHGAEFRSLHSVIEQYLTVRCVDIDWKNTDLSEDQYDSDYLTMRFDQLEKARPQLQHVLDCMIELILFFQRVGRSNEATTRILEQLSEFDRLFKRMQNNLFFQVIVLPMNRFLYESLYGQVEFMKLESDYIKKATKVGKYYGDFIQMCKEDMRSIEVYWFELSSMMNEVGGMFGEKNKFR